MAGDPTLPGPVINRCLPLPEPRQRLAPSSTPPHSLSSLRLPGASPVSLVTPSGSPRRPSLSPNLSVLRPVSFSAHTHTCWCFGQSPDCAWCFPARRLRPGVHFQSSDSEARLLSRHSRQDVCLRESQTCRVQSWTLGCPHPALPPPSRLVWRQLHPPGPRAESSGWSFRFTSP